MLRPSERRRLVNRIAEVDSRAALDQEPHDGEVPVQRGVVEYAVTRNSSTRRVASWAARVSAFPRPIMRVTVAAEPARATAPTVRTVTATSTSTSVNPARAGFT